MYFLSTNLEITRQGRWHLSTWVCWVLLSFCAVFLIACLGSSDSDVSAWITIESPSSDPYITDRAGVDLSGLAFINPELSNMDNNDPGVFVIWENLTTAVHGSARQFYGYYGRNCVPFGYCSFYSRHNWSAYIPIIEGDNIIEVRAYDSLGNWAEDTITISNPIYHSPLILSIYWATLIPGYTPFAVYISSDKLWFEAKVDTGNLPTDVRFDWDTSGNNFTSSYESSLTQSLTAAPEEQSVFSAATGIPFGTSFNSNLDFRVVAGNSVGEELETINIEPLVQFTVQTGEVNYIGPTEATVYGSFGGPAWSRNYFEWSTDPHLAFYETAMTSGTQLTLEGLQDNTTYYYRAMSKSYAPSFGIGFRGEIKSFSTPPAF